MTMYSSAVDDALTGPIGDCPCSYCAHGSPCQIGKIWNLRRALEQETRLRKALESRSALVVGAYIHAFDMRGVMDLNGRDTYLRQQVSGLAMLMKLHQNYDLWEAKLSLPTQEK
jgi:hypothetical protein